MIKKCEEKGITDFRDEKIVDKNILWICKQVFTELEEIGKTIKEEVQDAGLGHSHAEIMEGGDINKCPYYAAKMGKTSFEEFRFKRNTLS